MPAKIFLAEDDLELSAIICETLNKEGYDCRGFSNPREALEACRLEEIDLLLTDLKMPEMNGIELAQRTLEAQPDTRVIVITGYSTLTTVIDAMRAGIDNYILKPFRSEELLFNVRRSIERRRMVLMNRRYQAGLEQMVAEQTEQLVERHKKLCRSQLESIFAIGNIIEARDAYTRGHTERVTVFAVALAEKMGWSEQLIRELGVGSPLHDIGKIGVPDSILKKKGRLTFQEMEMMKLHPEIGYEMVKGSEMAPGTVEAIIFHHERYGGGGYPFGLEGKNIPETGRLMAICDAFDAMTSDRVYRPALPLETAIGEMKKESGSQFDPEMTTAFLELIKEGTLDATIIRRGMKREFEKLISRLTAV